MRTYQEHISRQVNSDSALTVIRLQANKIGVETAAPGGADYAEYQHLNRALQ
jgi:hypothetical protein